MTPPSTKVVVSNSHDLDYKTMAEIVKTCGGFMRIGAREGQQIEVWHGDIEYVFEGEGLIEFLFAMKHKHVDQLYKALDLCDYIADSAKQPPSKFVRDAIVNRAGELRREIKGENDG